MNSAQTAGGYDRIDSPYNSQSIIWWTLVTIIVDYLCGHRMDNVSSGNVHAASGSHMTAFYGINAGQLIPLMSHLVQCDPASAELQGSSC